MTEMFGEAWSPMSVPDLAPDDDDIYIYIYIYIYRRTCGFEIFLLNYVYHLIKPIFTKSL